MGIAEYVCRELRSAEEQGAIANTPRSSPRWRQQKAGGGARGERQGVAHRSTQRTARRRHDRTAVCTGAALTKVLDISHTQLGSLMSASVADRMQLTAQTPHSNFLLS